MSQWIQRLNDKRIYRLALLGFSAGLPILLIFSTLSLWLSEAGAARSTVTFFSWAALGYSFKFIWAPLVDKLPLPVVGALLGRRRSWLLLAQLAVALSIVLMAITDPAQDIQLMAFAAVLLGFSSATQDIVIDAYRIECAPNELQALLSSAYVVGYRVGMIAAGAGSLYLAELLGSTPDNYSYSAWSLTYLLMAALMAVGVITTLTLDEPRTDDDGAAVYPHSGADYGRLCLMFLCAVSGFVLMFSWLPRLGLAAAIPAAPISRFLLELLRLLSAIAVAGVIGYLFVSLGLLKRQLGRESFVEPVTDFFSRYGKLAIWVLLLIGVYRLSDIVMGVVANLFYQDMGFSKSQIASVTKVFGLLMTIAGSFAGGLLAVAIGVRKVLLLGAVLSALTNVLFMLLARSQPDIAMLTGVIAADNLSAGIAVAAFIAWLSSLTNMAFTAVQYAIFSSVMTLIPKLFGGYSGTIVDSIGYEWFFLLTAALGIPVILLVWFVRPEQVNSRSR